MFWIQYTRTSISNTPVSNKLEMFITSYLFFFTCYNYNNIASVVLLQRYKTHSYGRLQTFFDVKFRWCIDIDVISSNFNFELYRSRTQYFAAHLPLSIFIYFRLLNSILISCFFLLRFSSLFKDCSKDFPCCSIVRCQCINECNGLCQCFCLHKYRR